MAGGGGFLHMAGNVKHIPDGWRVVTPYLVVKDAARAIEFYGKAFGAKEVMRLPGPGGKIGHAELKIGGEYVMLADEVPEQGHKSPVSLGGSPVRIHLYVEDVDAVARRAVEAGAKILIPIGDQFYGDRSGRIEDPFGHIWIISTHQEDVTPAEMEKRMEAFFKKQGA
jgi:PhnB protein